MIPDYVLDGLTSRQWKAHKRQELKYVFQALDNYRLGCAYCPGYEEVSHIQCRLERIKAAQSVKSWGR